MVLEFFRYWRRKIWKSVKNIMKNITAQQWWHSFLPSSSVDWKFQIIFILSTVAFLYILLRLWRSVRERQIRIIPASWNGIHAHQWSLIQCLTHRATCCICRSLIVDAMFCDSCGVCLDFSCYEVYMSKFRFRKRKLNNKSHPLLTIGQCKTVSVASNSQHNQATSPSSNPTSTSLAGDSITKEPSTWNHSWIHGNLQTRSKCIVCGQQCDIEEYEHDESLAGDHTLYHYRCCWCQRVVHEHCYDSNLLQSTTCDFGHWSKYILPPFCLLHKRVWSSRARGRIIVLDSVKDYRLYGQKDWTPLFVVANRKSGNNDAGNVLRRFSTVLNPLQVIDLSQDSSQLSLALQICSLLPKDVQARFLVAGGDGTVGWVLNTIRQMDVDPIPSVAIYPLGTGNDLARVLHWMNQSLDSPNNDTSHLDRNHIVQNIFNAKEILLDRWNINIKHSDSRFRTALLSSLHIPRSILSTSNRQLFMYNYFSVGVDALVALNFHQTRKGWLYKFLFTNTLINKFIYFTYGTKDLLERRCANLNSRIRIELDGKAIELPQLEAILVLNISSYGGGVKLKIPDNGTGMRHSLNDGKIEVFGLCSSLHIGQIMVGLSSPIFLGQAQVVRLELLEHLPVQVDGEPWLQSPSKIELTWNSHAKLLQHHS